MISKGKRVMVGDQYYDIRCLSGDPKPTKNIKNGSILTEIDTGKTYLFNAETGTWGEVDLSGGGGIRALNDEEMAYALSLL